MWYYLLRSLFLTICWICGTSIAGVKRTISWKAWPQHLPVWPTSLSLFLHLSKEKRHGRSGWRTTTVEPKFISTTSWHIMGNQTRWDVITVKSLYTTHFVPMHSRRKTEGERNRRRWGFLMDCLEAKGAWLIGRRRTQRAGERALVIWSVRQLGLSSETRWGEVGDHVWGPPSCYCP